MADDKQQPDDNPHPMSQDEIDALFEQMASEMPAAEIEGTTRAHLSSTGRPPVAAEPSAGEDANSRTSPGTQADLRQSDIDRLLGELGGVDDAISDDGDDETAAETPVPAAAPAPAPATTTGAMGQSEIDALLAEMGVEATEQAPAPSAGPMGQSEIDALLAEMGVDDSPVAPAPVVAEPATANGALDQAAIDALLAGLSGGQADPEETLAGPGPIQGGAMGQSEIDALLAEMGVGGLEAGRNLPGHDTERLSTQQIAEIVSKHETGHAQPEPEDSGESMISQEDIDALVRQMSMATVVPDKQHIDAMLSEQESDIDALLDQAQRAGEVTDAMQASMTPMLPQPMQGMVAMLPSGTAVMAPDELRGTRFLLVAAVFLLAMCTMTMVFVANAINGLTGELREGRSDEVKPQDGYEQDVAVGLELLASDDAVEVKKGLNFFEHLKKQYRSRSTELQELYMLLGDHHRRHGAWARAIKEYELLIEQQGEYRDDPRFYLAYSDSLFQLQRHQRAQEVLMQLLANEGRFAQPLDEQGKPRQAEIVQREREVLQKAYLLLGRLYSAEIERLPAPRADAGEES